MSFVKARIVQLVGHLKKSRRLRLTMAAVGLLLAVLLAPTGLDDLPDMESYSVGSERKAAFFNYLKPIVEFQNERILDDRRRLLALPSGVTSKEQLSLIERYRLKSLAERYEVDWDASNLREVKSRLKRRIDMVPESLVLVQAAKESGWGTSKFARQGNNLFGQWCYQPGCGMVPAKRAAGAIHEVKVFDSVSDAVAGYLKNINTGNPYRSLRDLRARQRQAGKIPDAIFLADGLLMYSQRRQAYVNEVKGMIHQYRKFQSGPHG